MLCAPSNHQRKWRTSSIFVFCTFSREQNWHKLRNLYWIWQVAKVRSINHNVGRPKRSELLRADWRFGTMRFVASGDQFKSCTAASLINVYFPSMDWAKASRLLTAMKPAEIDFKFNSMISVIRRSRWQISSIQSTYCDDSKLQETNDTLMFGLQC